jgi:TonB family protein
MITSAAAHKHDWTNERRSCSRESLNWIVLVFFGHNNWGKLIDLSEKGMCFRFEQPPSLREPIEFTFEAMGCMSIPHEANVFGDSFQAAGRVVWTHEFERTAGVQFLNLSQRSRDQIRYWLSSTTGQASVPPQDPVNVGHTAGLTEELKREWDAEWDRRTGQQAPEPFAPRVAPPSLPKAPAEPILETSELKMEELDSHLESLWQREATFSPQPPPGQSVFLRDPVEEPGAQSQETTGFNIDSPLEVEHEFVAENPAPLPNDTQSFWRPEPEIAPQDLETQPADAQMVRAVRAHERLEQSGFEAPPIPEQEEQPRRGATLRMRPQRARVGYVVAVTCLGTLLVAAAVIAIANKSGGKAGAGEVGSLSSENRVDATSEERGAVESSGPFLVEVLDSSSRRSVLWFTGDSHQEVGTREVKPAPALSAASASSHPIAEEKPLVTSKSEPVLDFTLASPHPASETGTSASASSSEALVAPTIGEAPGTADVPLHANLPSPAAPTEGTLPVGGDVQPARLIRAVLPAYPLLAKSNRVVGDVTLDALIDASGNVRDVSVISGPVFLRESAKGAVKQWKYEPARLDGQPTAMHLTVTVKFKGDQK